MPEVSTLFFCLTDCIIIPCGIMAYENQGLMGMPKQFVLCFDGTGNKFAGDESDSNVLKIFRVSETASQGLSPC